MRPRSLVAIPMAASLILLAVPATPSAADQTTEQTIIVTMDSAKGATQAAEDAVAAAGGTVTEARAIGGRAVAVTVSGVSASAAKKLGEATADQTGVTAAQKSLRFHATSTNDTDYSYLWNLNNASGSTYGVDAEDAWATTTGAGAYVAVIDSGITSHSDLNANVVAGYDFVSDATQSGDGDGYDADPTDVIAGNDYHGTHVAGIVAAVRNNSKGVVGVAPDAKVQPIRVLGADGGSEEDIIAAIRWAAGLSVPGVATNPTPASAINLSLGGSGSCSYALQSAIDAAVGAGTAVVVAAGNADDNGTTPLANITPANCANVIRVTASTNTGALAWYSDYGTSTAPATIAAPGGSASSNSDDDASHWIISTWHDNGSETYTGMIGTSMATPHVSGVIALLKAKWPNLTVAQLVGLLASTAKSMSGGCTTTMCGAGIVNAAAAVASAAAGPPASVNVSVNPPTISGSGKVGSTLYGVSSGYTPTSGEATWQWLRNGVAIVGATSQAYVPVTADAGAALTVRETVRYFDATGAATSGAKYAYRYTFRSLSKPKIKGTYKVGHKLKAKGGSAKPSATGRTYQWLRGGTAIAGATGGSYRLVAADRKQKISVKITVSRSGYAARSATSSSHKVK